MKTYVIKRVLRALILVTILSTATLQFAGEPRYWVYCANGKIEVAMWDLEQMMVRRGSDVFLLGAFESLTTALSYATRFGGKGACCGKK